MQTKIDKNKQSLRQSKDGTVKSIAQGVYDPIEMLSHRSKNNRSSSLLPSQNFHKSSKTIFDWKKQQMKKHNFPHFGELTLDVADVKKQELKKSFPLTNSVDKLGAKREHYNTMMNSTYADSEMPYGAQYQSTDYVK